MLNSSKLYKLTSSLFVRQISILSSGNAISYLLAFIALPILTRIFPKESFDWLTLYISFISIGGVILSLQYEKALVVCKENHEVSKLFFLSILSATFITLFLFLLTFITLQFSIFSVILDKYSSSFLVYIIIGAWAAAVYQSAMQLLNKQEAYTLMSFSKVVVALLTVCFQFLFWKYPIIGLPLALVIGHVLGKGLSLIVVSRQCLAVLTDALNYSLGSYKSLIIKFKDFQKFNLTAVIIDKIASELPVLLITIWFTQYLADYGMAFRVLMIPLALFCTSYSQVFMRKASDLWNKNDDIRPLIKKTWLFIGSLLIVPFILLLIFGSHLFGLVFGEEWSTAGKIAAYLVPVQWFTAISSTTSVTYTVIRKQKYMVIFSIISIFYRIGSFSLGYYLGDFERALFAFTICNITVLLFYNIILFKYSNPKYNKKKY